MKFGILLYPLLLLGCATACRDTYILNPSAPSTVDGGALASRPLVDTIEFRVVGNAIAARVRHTSSLDGLTQITTALPYLAHFDSTASSVFLSLDATPTAYQFGATPGYTYAGATPPFLLVQIFINGALFRETSASDGFLSTISVSGTWRRN